VKVLIGIATAASALLAAGGIMAALPGTPAIEGTRTRVGVAAVVDGDRLRVEDLAGCDIGRVRLLDAPEVAHPPTPAECYAEAATDRLEELAPVGGTVRLTTDTAQPDRDRDGRMLRYVDHADVDVSRELLASGAARPYDSDRQLARETAYAAAVDDAHDAGSGLWGNC